MEKQENALAFSMLSGGGEFRWGAGLTVLFALSGHATIHVGARQAALGPAGMLAINPFELFRVDCGAEGRLVCMDVPREYLRLAARDGAAPRVLCEIADDAPGVGGAFDRLRALYARIFRDFFQDDPGLRPRMTGALLALLGVLFERFAAPEGDVPRAQEQAADRLARILTYVHDHWREDLSLSGLAAREYLSPNYLSRFFTKHLHMGFTEYLTGLRLEYARQALVQGGDSVTRVAYECGFKNVNSMIEAFRIRFGETPGQYRRAARSRSQMQLGGCTSDRAAEDLSVLLRYAGQEEALAEGASPVRAQTREVAADVRAQGTPLRHTWRRLVNIGYARDGLVAPVQALLRRAQREIGFEYLRFHGIFDEDMRIYREDERGAPRFDFTYTDLLFDFIISLGLKPYLELSFIPPALALSKVNHFDRRSYMTVPNDEAKWRLLVRQTLLHLTERYGREALRQWRFTTLPISIPILGSITYEQYYRHFQLTYEAVKSVDPAYPVGGPGGFASAVWDNACMEHFLIFTRDNGCLPDFFTTQCYPHRAIEHDHEFMRFTVSQDSSPSVLSRDEHFTQTLLRDFRALLRKFGAENREIWLDEWNSTLWQRDLSSDTCYKSAWLVKNACENYDGAEAFGYWLLTDFIEERASLGSVFHGGYGLFTYNGIPKAGWQAMLLLRRLGDTLLHREQGCFITRGRREIQILLCRYCHYDNLYRYRYRVLTKPDEAYSVFVKKEAQRFVLRLDGLEDGVYSIRRRAIDPAAGSAFDKWREIGAPEYMRADELDYLADASRPAYFVSEQSVHGVLSLEAVVPPHGVQLLTVTRLERAEDSVL